jgi:hypothetical protein
MLCRVLPDSTEFCCVLTAPVYLSQILAGSAAYWLLLPRVLIGLDKYCQILAISTGLCRPPLMSSDDRCRVLLDSDGSYLALMVSSGSRWALTNRDSESRQDRDSRSRSRRYHGHIETQATTTLTVTSTDVSTSTIICMTKLTAAAV